MRLIATKLLPSLEGEHNDYDLLFSNPMYKASDDFMNKLRDRLGPGRQKDLPLNLNP